jgi:hypothetical protein
MLSGLFGSAGGDDVPKTPPVQQTRPANRMRGPGKDILTDLENPASLDINSDSDSGKKKQPRRRTLKI